MFDNNQQKQMQHISTASGQDGGESVMIWACFIVSIDLQCTE